MNEPIVRAASFVDADGYGSMRGGKQPWPATYAAALQRAEIPDRTWSAMFGSSCPRFGRMDALSRLGLMAVELLGVDFVALPEGERDNIGVCMETRCGCLATDRRFLETFSPNVFAYTLPSTAIGEICIRHRLRGPVLCLMTGDDNARPALDEAVAWLEAGTVSGCICLSCDALKSPETNEPCIVAAAVFLSRPTRAECACRWSEGASLAAGCRELCLCRTGRV